MASAGSAVAYELDPVLTKTIDAALSPPLAPSRPPLGVSPAIPMTPQLGATPMDPALAAQASHRIAFLLAPDVPQTPLDKAEDQQALTSKPVEHPSPPSIWTCCGASMGNSKKLEVLDKIAEYVRRVVGFIMVLLLLFSIVILLVSFLGGIFDNVGKGIGLLLGYFVSSTLTYYLEGGQAARFMAKGLPPSFFFRMPVARAFVARDEQDPGFILNYMGVRQFLTLGTTTVAGAIILAEVSPTFIFGVDHPAAPAVLLISHLIFTTTICQVLPQIRAERNLSFLTTYGSLFTYYCAAVLGKVIDTSAPAEWIHLSLNYFQEKCHCWEHDALIDSQTRPRTVSGESSSPPKGEDPYGNVEELNEKFTTDGVWKYPPNARWPAPGKVAERLQNLAVEASQQAAQDSNLLKSTPRFLLPPAHPLHVPPHVVLTVAHVLANETNPDVDVGTALRQLLAVAADGTGMAQHGTGLAQPEKPQPESVDV